ncbi:hypothetical protein LOZ51_003374 [Ophidiomyces ophidiicola]|nr:hypothetical protein LOZ55_001101 [Ophidiomyces ophidiicola]KAI1995548.1 hypothetical protein LOZ51_003374 [Ophidiomyces ophidiicola]KAI1996113.1 hypothetical protein LOZ54_000409 [Ophidiomyces ophidiicola]
MTLRKANPDDAPPPYTPTDPLTPASSSVSANGELPAPPTTDPALVPVPAAVSEPEPVPEYEHVSQPTDNFISAVPFFAERPPTLPHSPHEEVLQHTITIYSRSQARDYSRFPRCWRSRSEEVTDNDWRTFLNYLLPSHLGPASHHPGLPHKLRQEIERDHRDCSQESDDQRRARIATVVEEWNHHFFRPRAMAVSYCFAPEAKTETISPLCPRCYPSTVRSMPIRHGSGSNLSRSQTAPPEALNSIPRKPVGTNTTQPSVGQSQSGRNEPNGTQSDGPQNFGNQSYIGSWASAIQNWATNLSEQAQIYGDTIERQANERGRQFEARAEAFGRMMEARGNALENYFEQQEKRFEGRSARCEPSCESRSSWQHPWTPSGPRARGAGCGNRGAFVPQYRGRGRGRPGWNGSSWNRWDQTTSSQRPRSASISSLSSSLSSSSSSSDSLSSHSSEDDQGSSVADALRQQRIQARHLSTEHHARTAALRHEMCALRAAHKELRSSCNRRGGADHEEYSFDKVAEAQAIKVEVGNLKQEYKNTRNEFRQERKQLRKVRRDLRKERRKEIKAEKKQRKNKGKGMHDSFIASYEAEYYLLILKGPVQGLPQASSGLIPVENPPPPVAPPTVPVEPPSSTVPANQYPPIPETSDIPLDAAAEIRAHTAPSPTQIQQEKSKLEAKSKAKEKTSSSDAVPKSMTWGWTRGAGSKASSRKKAKEGEPQNMQWSGDGQQENGVLIVGGDGRERAEMDGAPQPPNQA